MLDHVRRMSLCCCRTLRRRAAALAAMPVLALLALLTSAEVAAAQRRCAPFTAHAQGLWTAADIDGDRVPDLVGISGAGRSPASGIRVVSGGCQSGPLPLLGAALNGDTLEARDLDADRDLDLVHLDAFGVPLRVWLNDGAGRFERVAVAHAGRTPPARHVGHDDRGLRGGVWFVTGTTALVAPAGGVGASPVAALARRSRRAARRPGRRGRAVCPRGPPVRSLPHA
jgi:hypothetical protein